MPEDQVSDSTEKKDLKTTIIATSIVLILLFGAVLTLLAEGSSDDDNDTTWVPAVGDYYTLTQTANGIENYVIMTCTVIDVTSDTVSFNESFRYYNGLNGSTIQTTESNQSAPYTYVGIIENPPSDYDVQDDGYSVLSTEWGYVAAHHYVMTCSVFPNIGTIDLWFYNGFCVKMIMDMDSGLEVVMELTDTNIDL